MNLTERTLKRPVTAFMIFICILVIGIIASRLIPLEYFPDMDFPVVNVNIPYPGSTPEEIERQITRPLEEALATIGGIKKMNSFSTESASNINLRFDWGVNTNIKAVEVKEKIDSIRTQLPDDIEHIQLNQASSNDVSIMSIRLSSKRDISESYDMLNRVLKRPLERIRGVSRVDIHGVSKKEIRIQLIADRISAHHIDIGKLGDTLRQSNFLVTGGNITDANKRYRVRPIGELNSIKELEDLIIGENNLRLKDIATVSYEQPRLEFGRHLNRQFAVGLDIFKEFGANTVDTSQQVKNELEKISKDPRMDGIRLFFMEDRGDGILSSLNELIKSGVIGALLAICLLFFFMRRISTTFIVALAIPFSLLITLAFMFFFKISINILSMMGLLLAVGMLVDNAVVVTESIHRHQALEKDPKKASLNGVKEVAVAIFAGTLTTVVVFLPNIISQRDEMSIYMKFISVVFVIALFASLILALTIVPLLTSRFKISASHTMPLFLQKLSQWYGRALHWILTRRKLSALFMFLIVFSIMIPFMVVKKDMFPQQEDRRLRLFYNINGTYTLKKVESVVDIVEGYLYAHKDRFEIDSVYSYYEGGTATSTILLKKGKEARKSQENIRLDIQEGLPKVSIATLTFEVPRSMGSGEKLLISLHGDSSSRLVDLSLEAARILSQIPGLTDVKSEATSGEQEIQVVVNRERASQLGISSSQVSTMVSVAMRGMNLRRFRDENGEIDVRAQFREGDKQTLDQLQNLIIYDKDKRPIKLTTIAEIGVRRGPRTIFHENRLTAMNVTMNLNGLSVDEAQEKITQIMAGFQLPAGYSWDFGTSFDFEKESSKNMMINTLLALFLIYFIMASIFESLVFPAAIWSSIIFAIVGVWWFFMITNTTFSLMAWIGVLILIGVVVNNGIVLIDHIERFRKNGYNRHDAIIEAGKERIRPILMTAGTTIFSLVPLCIANTQVGGDGPPYYPMARAIVGGLLFSTVVTLLILPRIYVMLDDMRNWAYSIIKNAAARTESVKEG